RRLDAVIDGVAHHVRQRRPEAEQIVLRHAQIVGGRADLHPLAQAAGDVLGVRAQVREPRRRALPRPHAHHVEDLEVSAALDQIADDAHVLLRRDLEHAAPRAGQVLLDAAQAALPELAELTELARRWQAARALHALLQ